MDAHKVALIAGIISQDGAYLAKFRLNLRDRIVKAYATTFTKVAE